MDRFDRIYRLHRIFRSARHPVSRKTLEEKLECSRATVNRAIEDLRDFLWAPLRYDRLRNGYYYDEKDGERPYELPGLWFNASELYALLATQKLLAGVGPGLLDGFLAPLRKRIEHILANERARSARPASRSDERRCPGSEVAREAKWSGDFAAGDGLAQALQQPFELGHAFAELSHFRVHLVQLGPNLSIGCGDRYEDHDSGADHRPRFGSHCHRLPVPCARVMVRQPHGDLSSDLGRFGRRRSAIPVQANAAVRARPFSRSRPIRLRVPHIAVQPDSTSNATTLRVSRLNSTATRWIGSPAPRYLSA